VKPNAGNDLSNGSGLLQAYKAGLAWLRSNSEAIDRLNVFPVPDGDTGTNMVLTLQEAVAEAEKSASESATVVAGSAARGALMGARGNSGVILSQIIRGISVGLEGLEEFSSCDFALALAKASDIAYQSVSKPVEGTMLTVIRHAGSAAMRADSNGADVGDVLEAAVLAAERSVEDTPNKLAVLKEAGVVDAGGQGIYIILDGFRRHYNGQEIPSTGTKERVENVFAGFAQDHEHDEQGFCTQFLIAGESINVDIVRQKFEETTNSTIVVGDQNLVRVHVHTMNPGDALNYAVQLGQVSHISIENMQLQQETHLADVSNSNKDDTSASVMDVVAISSGPGFSDIMRSIGVSVVDGGPTTNPSTAEIIAGIDRCPGMSIVVLPNDANVLMAAQQAAKASERVVHVLDSRTMPEGVSAALAFSVGAEFEANVQAMNSAINEISTLEVTRATKDLETNEFSIRKGQNIGLVDSEIKVVAENPDSALAELIELMDSDDVELVTVYVGEDVGNTSETNAANIVQDIVPDADVEVVYGGQPHYDYVVGIE
tara:strand:- start:11291 stop:12922 length:1632 start_codon:yes stop_codon:yes gene_type:complete